MNINIISKKESPLLNRLDVQAELSYESSTPKRQDIRKQAAKLLSVDEKLVAVEKIAPKYGAKAAKATIHVYKDENTLKRTEREHILKRMEGRKKEAEEK